MTQAKNTVPRGSRQELEMFFTLQVVAESRNSFAKLTGEEETNYVVLPTNGHVPGPAVLLEVRGEKVLLLDATPGAMEQKIEVPTGWMDRSELPENILQQLQAREALVEGLGGNQLTPFRLKSATQFLWERNGGLRPGRSLTAGYVQLQLRMEESEPTRVEPYGLALISMPGITPHGEVTVLAEYNPGDFASSLQPGKSYSLENLFRDSKAALKMLRVWRAHESNLQETLSPTRR